MRESRRPVSSRAQRGICRGPKDPSSSARDDSVSRPGCCGRGTAMLKLLLSRLATAVPSLVGVVIVTFMLTRMLPGDPAAYFAGLAASPQAIAEIRAKLGLDRSLPEQFVAYVGDLLHGDLGNSLSTGQPVRRARSPPACRPRPSSPCSALLLAVAIAMPLGVAGGGEAGHLDRPSLPHRHHGRRVAAGVLHRPAVGLRLLLSCSDRRRRRSAGSTSSCRRHRTSPAST